MKNRRLIIAAFMGLFLTIALCGCSGGENLDSAVRDGISDIVQESDFDGKSFDEKGQAIEDYLHQAADDELENEEGNTVIDDSIEYDEGSHTCIYTDSDGALNIVDFGERDQYTVADDDTVPEFRGNAEQQIDAKGILLYGIDAESSTSAGDYKMMARNMSEIGLECDIDTDMTVEDYKTKLYGQDFVLIETHGSTLNYGYGFQQMSSVQTPVLCTREDITPQNLEEYKDDIAEQRIAKVTVIENNSPTGLADRYWIMPSFFEKYYRGGALEDTYVHMGNCCGFGSSIERADGSLDYTLAQTFIDCGADAVTGYYNSVFTYYDYDMIRDIMTFLSEGNNLSDSVNLAKSYNGEDDQSYAQRMGWLNPENPWYNDASAKLREGVAYINLMGAEDLNFVKQIQEATTEATTQAPTQTEPAKPVVHSVAGVWKNGEYEKLVLKADGTGYWVNHMGAEEFTYHANGSTVTFTRTAAGQDQAQNFTATVEGDRMTVNDLMNGGAQQTVFVLAPGETE